LFSAEALSFGRRVCTAIAEPLLDERRHFSAAQLNPLNAAQTGMWRVQRLRRRRSNGVSSGTSYVVMPTTVLSLSSPASAASGPAVDC